MVATASIVIELGQGERHQAASLEGLREVFLTLARQARDARAEYVASPVRARMVESRMRLGSALIQLRPQVGHGHWRAFLNTLGEAANVSRHTLYRSVRMAAALATKTGDIDPAKVRAAREAIAAVANRKNGSNVARAQHFTGMGEADSNVARAQHLEDEYLTETGNPVARAQLDVRDSRTYDGELDSMREAEQLARALEDNFGEEAEDDGEMGCSGEQMTFATLVAEARTAVERVVEFGAMGRDADPVAAHELAESLRAAADRIEARAKAGPATPQPLRS